MIAGRDVPLSEVLHMIKVNGPVASMRCDGTTTPDLPRALQLAPHQPFVDAGKLLREIHPAGCSRSIAFGATMMVPRLRPRDDDAGESRTSSRPKAGSRADGLAPVSPVTQKYFPSPNSANLLNSSPHHKRLVRRKL